jgi:hypothetical protein
MEHGDVPQVLKCSNKLVSPPFKTTGIAKRRKTVERYVLSRPIYHLPKMRELKRSARKKSYENIFGATCTF